MFWELKKNLISLGTLDVLQCRCSCKGDVMRITKGLRFNERYHGWALVCSTMIEKKMKREIKTFED